MTASWLKRLLFWSAATGGGAWETVTGAIASFFVTNAKPVRLSFLLTPIQAGSGDPSPENVRAISGHESATVMQCKENLLAGKIASGKSGSVTYTVNSDGSVLTTGITTSTAVLRSDEINVSEGETYKLYGCPNGGGIDTYRLDVRDLEGNLISTLPYDIGSGATITIPSGTTTIKIGIRIAAGNDVSGLVFKPILAKSADVYTPKVATFPSVVYGGEVDWNAGKLYSDYDFIDMGELNWINTLTDTTGNTRFYAVLPHEAVVSDTSHVNSVCTFLKLLSSGATYSCIQGHTIAYSSNEWRVYAYIEAYKEYTKQEFKTAVAGQKLAYKVATPTEVSLSDIDSIVPVAGTNNVWVDNSDLISVDYFGIN